ncbi:N-acetylmuramoyl-L-alanine amidase [Fonticella tunisiensis]|uniref:SpoIID/LytB domain protein n=1 Tax=Fonticella tunisiensis TaxID=1096341 RepID=A0A4R7KV01_9CLOT|nr:N-acetylmuramoyl-L-alanine amidase [Fonticella tunisiensis]TDT62337.1 SpoIID/LytB domain protein [Fonticella tunisiensis]
MEKVLVEVFSKDGRIVKEDINFVIACKLAEMEFHKLNIEVIKAIVVLLRSSLYKNIKGSKYYLPGDNYIVIQEDIFNSLEYEQKEIIKRAMDETEGIVAISGDNLVEFYYTKCCGGGTSNSEEILGYRVNYLRRVLCRHCSNSYKEKVISLQEIKDKLSIKGTEYKNDIDNILKNIKRDETGRIIEINVMGRILSGEEFINLFNLESTRVFFVEDSLRFKVIGEGLGLGICIDGANSLASQGVGYKDIIKHYYTGIEFKNVSNEYNDKPLINRRIVIDPGHGGKDSGNVKEGVVEKDVNLYIALSLQKLLEKTGLTVVLTRTCDEYKTLGERVELINSTRPDFFISIHQNSFFHSGVNGVESYCYEKDNEAIKLGELICRKISERIEVKDRGVRVGDYYLLRECKVSGIILECMYMSGNRDIMKYTEENYKAIAQAIFDAICLYYGVIP